MATNDDDKIAALQRERRGYEVFGRTDRVAEVDAELVKLGVEVDAKPKRASKKASD